MPSVIIAQIHQMKEAAQIAAQITMIVNNPRGVAAVPTGE
jgi:hypothetical protein